MRYITLSGVDGSGKSTQLALLKVHLEKNGRKIAVFNAVEFSSANRIARFFKGGQKFEPGKDKAVTEASWASIVLREKFLVLDFLRFRFLLRKLKRKGFDYVLSDRSFYDSIVNIEYLLSCHPERARESKNPGIHGIRFLDKLGMTMIGNFLPKSDIAFFLDIEPEIIMKRERVPEQGIDYLRTKTALFTEKIPAWNLIVVDAGRDRESVFQEILKRI